VVRFEKLAPKGVSLHQKKLKINSGKQTANGVFEIIDVSRLSII
jgi:hypothetical protein